MKSSKHTNKPEIERNIVGGGRRFSAYLIDWLLSSLFIALPIVFINSIALNTPEVTDNLLLIPNPYNYYGFIGSIIFYILYFIILPNNVWKGQTPGKKMMKIKMTKTDGRDVDLKALLLRYVIGIFLLESVVFSPSRYIRDILADLSGEVWFIQYPYYLGLGISLLSCVFVIFSISKRAIHDHLANTKVVMVNESVPNTRKVI